MRRLLSSCHRNLQQRKEVYDQYQLNKTTTDFGELEDRLKKLWTKVNHENDPDQVEKDMKRIDTIVEQVCILKKMKIDHQMVEWDPLIENIDRCLTTCQENDDTITSRMKAQKDTLLHGSQRSLQSAQKDTLLHGSQRSLQSGIDFLHNAD